MKKDRLKTENVILKYTLLKISALSEQRENTLGIDSIEPMKFEKNLDLLKSIENEIDIVFKNLKKVNNEELSKKKTDIKKFL